MHPFMKQEVNLAWPAASFTIVLASSLWFSDFLTLTLDCCDLLPAGRAQMQFPFSIFYMHIKRLFTFQFPASSLLQSPSLPPFLLATCYKHIKINILQVAQKTAKDSATVEDARRRRGEPLLCLFCVWEQVQPEEQAGLEHSVQIQMCAEKCMRTLAN